LHDNNLTEIAKDRLKIIKENKMVSKLQKKIWH
jgi:hypothetical protein